MLIRESDVEDLYTVGGGHGDFLDHPLHLRVSRMMVTNIETQKSLRSRNVRAVFAAGVEVEFFFKLRNSGNEACKENRKRKKKGS